MELLLFIETPLDIGDSALFLFLLIIQSQKKKGGNKQKDMSDCFCVVTLVHLVKTKMNITCSYINMVIKQTNNCFVHNMALIKYTLQPITNQKQHLRYVDPLRTT